ncbi:MAG TPA: nitroreductase family deazaflavin-dependent oxidoreductase [Acidimicrobiales bacterium]|jgi:deazaflavin-dependent oxidoreductase (nitroreductase family)|nr:nitroreductase family deazaflavin-dependent oxidoreductase [Acidimicrobiales bacterium]
MTAQQTVSKLGFKTMNTLHRAVLKASGGKVLSKPFGMPAVELTTIGRKSGLQRSTMLTAPIHDAGRVVLVASKGGAEHDPTWYLNLTANPDVEVKIDGETRYLKARTASPEEKAELWPVIVGAYKGYAGYQTKTDRQIPVVICEPRDA